MIQNPHLTQAAGRLYYRDLLNRILGWRRNVSRWRRYYLYWDSEKQSYQRYRTVVYGESQASLLKWPGILYGGSDTPDNVIENLHPDSLILFPHLRKL